jgi:hypothetical protein
MAGDVGTPARYIGVARGGKGRLSLKPSMVGVVMREFAAVVDKNSKWLTLAAMSWHLCIPR